MARPLIGELRAREAPVEHFPEPEESLPALEAVVPEGQLRRRPPELPWLDEATLRAHFAHAVLGRDCGAPWAAEAERAASLPGLVRLHPGQPDATVQGALEVLHEVASALAALTGMDRFSLQPPTAAAAARAGLRLASKAFARTQPGRQAIVAAEESEAGALAEELGLGHRPVSRLASGDVDLDHLVGAVGETTAALVVSWLTPCGAFERNLAAAAEVAHARGALVCVDATGLGVLAGRTRLREAGADVAWLGLRELCPWAAGAALGVRRALTDFLPSPLVGRERGGYERDEELGHTIGPLALSAGDLCDALAVAVALRTLGERGLRARAERLAAQAAALARQSPNQYAGIGARVCLRGGARPRGEDPRGAAGEAGDAKEADHS
ncbi:MAG: hypothetical protein ACLF0G_16200 [Candidatus Brocadiia bacterium]